MARSPLFRSLQRALSHAHAANRLGLAPAAAAAALRTATATASAKPVEVGPSRRQFLGATLGAAALLPLAQACGDNLPLTDERVAIIGAGMAGLHCAYRLHQAGLHAQVFEASDRVGGRMYTGRGVLQGEQLFEYGGELIDTGHEVMHALAAEFGFALDDLVADGAGLRADTYHFDGVAHEEAAIVAEFMPLAARMATAVSAAEADEAEFERIDALSISAWLEVEGQLAPTSLIRRILERAYTGEYGLEASEQSVFNLLYLIDYDAPEPFRIFGDSDERYHVHQGNDALVSRLAAEVADEVRLGHVLTRIAAEGVAPDVTYRLTFMTSTGAVEVEVDRVVLALPFTTLRQIDLGAAGLPAEKLEVINNLGYGSNAKLMLQFSTRTWRIQQQAGGAALTDVGQLQQTWETSRGQAGAQGILTNYLGGQRGIDVGAGTAEERAAEVVPWIDTVFPGAGAAYLAGTAVRQHWPTHPFTLGSYACYTPGQWAYYGTEGTRVGNLHFCGEHTSEDFQGYMEGAAESGAMVAARILKDLGIDRPARLAALVDHKLATLPYATYGLDAPDAARQPTRPLRRGARRTLARRRDRR
ncbi:MAG: FAD-dependent oxidoreductase [Kofleriaceae bacterium]|nr:FAD-dependent oxidoreductase [Kofleriaceae bacterium]